jgi:ketosteroid isomerase-like protein
VKALEHVYEHWARGDWTPRFELYADDMEWGWSDEFPGLDGVFSDTRTPSPRLQTWLSGWETWTCEAEDYVEYGDTVVVLTRYRGRGRGSGVEVDREGAHVWKLRDGKAVRLEVFADRERALREAVPRPHALIHPRAKPASRRC